MRIRLFLLCSAFFIGPTALHADEPAAKPKVKLAVLLVFDQLRGDYIDKWQPQFSEGGFKRLQTEGAWFTDCHYPYATTSTGPGHASILSGTSPYKHGIVNNEWYDAKAGAPVYCAGLARYQFVPAKPAPKPEPGKPVSTVAKPKLAGTPDLLLSETVADQLKIATNGKGKVFGLSLKDRSAILPAGKKPDGVYWFSEKFITSNYYRDSLHPWVDAFNKSKQAESYFGKEWSRFKPDLNYEKFAGPDDQIGEAKGVGQGIKFPHPMDGGKKELTKTYYDALATSPFGNDILLALAKECIIAEKLGQDDVPDLLSVSFSSNDLVGHAWGPDSHEVLDMTLRSDAIVENFLKFLDEKVGKGNYSVVVTADHGICPLPEVSTKRGIDAKRFSPIKLILNAERHLAKTFGGEELAEEPEPKEGEPETPKKKNPKRWIEDIAAPNIYLNQRLIKSKNLDPAKVAEELAKYLRTQEGIAKAYSRKDLKGTMEKDDAIGIRAQKSYFAARSGDVYVVIQPYYLLGSQSTGTSHGTPHAYDTHVPLLAFGPGVVGGKHAEKVTPQHAAPIMADFLGTKPPADCEYAVPTTLKKK